jgi:putative copper export protein
MATQNVYFIIKYIGRIIHILAFSLIFGNVAFDLFYQRRVDSKTGYRSSYNGFIIALWVLVILSGLANMLLLIFEKKFERNIHYEIWKKSLIAKFLISIFLTPALEALIALGELDQDKVDSIALPIRFTILLLFILGSSFLRYYREYYMTSTIDNK